MLGRIALRVCGVEALKGRTLVGEEVLDSQMGVLDMDGAGALRTDRDKPFVAVFCERSVGEERMESRGLYRSGRLDFVMEFGVTAAMTEPVLDSDGEETGETVVIGLGIPATDSGLEFSLDVAGRQAIDALADPTSDWAELWRGLSSGVARIEWKRVSNAQDQTRIAAHQCVMTLEVLPDPPFGEALKPESVWARFFAKLDAVQHPLAEKLRDLVGAPDGRPEHERLRRRRGLTFEEAKALLATPASGAAQTTIQSVTSTSQ